MVAYVCIHIYIYILEGFPPALKMLFLSFCNDFAFKRNKRNTHIFIFHFLISIMGLRTVPDILFNVAMSTTSAQYINVYVQRNVECILFLLIQNQGNAQYHSDWSFPQWSEKM